MFSAQFTQSPDDNLRYIVDYDSWLGETETILNVTVVSDTLTSPPIAIAAIGIDTGGRQIEFFLTGGVDGEKYTVIVTITTSLGQIYERALRFTMKDVP